MFVPILPTSSGTQAARPVADEPLPPFTAAADLAALMADMHFHDAGADAPDGPSPLPAGGRALLLGFLALVYSPGDAQARLHNAPDAAIAWQVQSCLDEFADFQARLDYICGGTA